MWSNPARSRKGAYVAVLVEDHVFEDSAKLDGLPDVGLLLFCQADALGVAATLDVEHALAAPAVLVVPDEGTVVVC